MTQTTTTRHECEFHPASDDQGREIMRCSCGHYYRETCAFELSGMRCVLYRCVDCGWKSHSADPGWSKRAAEVHAEHLCPGHRVEQVTSPHPIPNHADKQTPA